MKIANTKIHALIWIRELELAPPKIRQISESLLL